MYSHVGRRRMRAENMQIYIAYPGTIPHSAHSGALRETHGSLLLSFYFSLLFLTESLPYVTINETCLLDYLTTMVQSFVYKREWVLYVPTWAFICIFSHLYFMFQPPRVGPLSYSYPSEGSRTHSNGPTSEYRFLLYPDSGPFVLRTFSLALLFLNGKFHCLENITFRPWRNDLGYVDPTVAEQD